jgi:hypothetical protein
MTRPNARPTGEFDLVDAQHFLAACDLDGFRVRCHDAPRRNVTMVAAPAAQARRAGRAAAAQRRPAVPTNPIRT